MKRVMEEHGGPYPSLYTSTELCNLRKAESWFRAKSREDPFRMVRMNTMAESNNKFARAIDLGSGQYFVAKRYCQM